METNELVPQERGGVAGYSLAPVWFKIGDVLVPGCERQCACGAAMVRRFEMWSISV